MKVTYIYHSGFLLEDELAYYLFDYYIGQIPELKKDKPLFVFVSHHHPDHYNPDIFKLIMGHEDTTYILSRDVYYKNQISQINAEKELYDNRIFTMKPHEELELPILKTGGSLLVKTLKSTDVGVAFIINNSLHSYYHGGDLNNWQWIGEPVQNNASMKLNYYKELEIIREQDYDVAFLPLDPRQKGYTDLGLSEFLNFCYAKYIFPMHFWEDYGVIGRFLSKKENAIYSKKANDRMAIPEIIQIKKPGQSFELEIINSSQIQEKE